MPHQQKVIQRKQGIADANGNCVILFDPPPLGMVLTGTITIIDSPGGIQWNVLNGNDTIDVIYGNNSCGSLQSGRNEQLQVQASNLTPGIIVNASFTAKAELESDAEIILPGHDAVNPYSGYTRVIINEHTGLSQINQVPLAPTDRALIIMLYPSQAGDSLTANIANVTSNVSGIDYLPATMSYRPFSVGSVGQGPIIVPVFGAIEPNGVRVGIASVGSGTQIVIMATPDPFFAYQYQPLAVEVMNGLYGTNFPAPVPVNDQQNNQNSNYLINKVSPTNSTVLAILPTPSGSSYWEIAELGVWCVNTTTSAGYMAIRGHTTGFEFLLFPLASGVTGSSFITPKITISEGLDVVDSALGVTGSGIVVYRSVPNTYNPG